MAVPSSVALGGLALVVTAGVGLAAVSAYAHKDEKAPATAGPSADPTPTPKQTETKPPKKQKPRKAVDVVPDTLVVVYNNSGISGLAADKAAQLEGAGWKVAGADNWYGNIPASTVYFPPGHKAEAEQLAKVLRIDRIKPAVAPMQFDRLTVIFTGA